MKKISSVIVTIEIIMSIILGLSSIIEKLPKISIIYFYISLIIILCSVLILVFYINARKPWSKDTRPYFLKLSLKNNLFKQSISYFKEKPPYNYEFRHANVAQKNIASPIDELELLKSKITIIIEDDPVGFKTKFRAPAYFITEELSVTDIIELIQKDVAEILSIGVCFISTPSRRANKSEVICMFRNIGQAIRSIFKDHEYRMISKIDSCLRSQYEHEYQGLKQGLHFFDSEFIVPSYVEEGRVLVYGSSFLFMEQEKPTMLSNTEYSQVSGLSYKNSNMSLWLEEKTKGRLKRKKCALIDIDKIRSSEPEEISTFISNEHCDAFVFDLLDISDIQLVKNIILKSEQSSNKKILYKFGPSMINSFIEGYKISVNEELEPLKRLGKKDLRGVLFAGSLSSITKKQVEILRNQESSSIILISNDELNDSRFLIEGISQKSNLIIAKSKKNNSIIVTTEFWVEKNTQYPDSELRDKTLDYFSNIAKQVNDGMSWIAFKGSDTAFNCLAYGIKLKKFYYCGHLIPGVICISDSKNDLLYYIIGGNVGDKNLLLKFCKTINNKKD